MEYSELLGHEQAGEPHYFSGKLKKKFSVSELLDSVVSREERIKEGGVTVVNKFENIGNPVQNQNVQQEFVQTVTQHQQQSVDLHNQVREAKGLFRNLKEDILDEADIEIEDEKEKKRLQNELKKAENALAELESATEQGQEPDSAAKGRLEEFFNSLAEKGSRLNKALELVTTGTQKVQKLARTYNEVAQNIGWPSVPPLLLGSDKK